MEDHEHRFYMQPKTYTDFVPIPHVSAGEASIVYRRDEYAILSCLCGVVKRVLVKDA